MTIDHLILRINDGWGFATVDLMRAGDGLWTAVFQFVEIWSSDGKTLLEQPPKKSASANDALRALVIWLRGKRVRQRGANGGACGDFVRVPKDLKFLAI